MTKILNQSDVAYYQDNGFVLVKGLIDKATVETIKHETEGLHERLSEVDINDRDGYGITWEDLPEGSPKRIRQLMGSQNVCPTIRDLSESDVLMGAIADLLGEDVELFHSKLMMKPAFKGTFTPWHSDWGYWKSTFKQPTLMNAFLAIDPSTLENGCIRYVPGSHKQYQEHKFFEDAKGFGIGLPGDIDAYDNIPVEMEPGDVAFHDAICVHASEPNRSPQSRVMNTFAYTTLNNVLPDEAAQGTFNNQLLKRDALTV